MNRGPGTNYFTTLDENVEISLTTEGQYAQFARCNGNPNVVALHVDTYNVGCLMFRIDFTTGNNIYQMTGTIESPAWTLLGGGGSVPNFADDEVPTGVIDGTNVTFTLANTPSPAASLQLYLQGQLQIAGADYTLAGPVITMTEAPLSGTMLEAWYRF